MKKNKIVIILITIIILLIVAFVTYNFISKNDKEDNKDEVINKVAEDDNYTETINLDEEDSDVTISEAGNYKLTGNLEHSVFVDALEKDVTITLAGVNINSNTSGAIVGINANTLTINLLENTTNTLEASGTSDYDAAIFSNSNLIIEGIGTLIVNGNQEEGEGIATEAKDLTINGGIIKITSNDDGLNAGGNGGLITINDGEIYINAGGDGIDSNKNLIINGGTIFTMGSANGGNAGIDTDDGYTINGGTVIALGTDMIESPLETSTQNTIIFNLNDYVEEGSVVSLISENNNEIITFNADKKFKTLIISSDALTNGGYYLYKDGSTTGTLKNGIYINGSYSNGTKITLNNTELFEVSSIVNSFGNSMMGR